MKFRITLLGEPKAKQSARFFKVGKFMKSYQPKEVVNYAEAVKYQVAAAMLAENIEIITTGVKLKIEFYFQKPKSHQKKQTAGINLPKTTRPDVDNLCKALWDGLNGVAFKDDGQIYSVYAEKYETDGQARTEIEIEF